MKTLTEQVAADLAAAGFTPDDPAIVSIRRHNELAAERQQVHVELRRGQFGATRPVRLDELQAS